VKKNFAGKEEEKYEIQMASDGGGGGLHSAIFGFCCHGAISALRVRAQMKGGKKVAACNAAGSKFAFIYPSGIARMLTKEEMDLSIAYRPKLGRMQAYGIECGGEVEKIHLMPPSAEE
jgi:hypothetical protein